MYFNEYDSARLQNYVRDPKKMGIPAKVGSKGADSKKPERKASSEKRRKYV